MTNTGTSTAPELDTAEQTLNRIRQAAIEQGWTEGSLEDYVLAKLKAGPSEPKPDSAEHYLNKVRGWAKTWSTVTYGHPFAEAGKEVLELLKGHNNTANIPLNMYAKLGTTTDQDVSELCTILYEILLTTRPVMETYSGPSRLRDYEDLHREISEGRWQCSLPWPQRYGKDKS